MSGAFEGPGGTAVSAAAPAPAPGRVAFRVLERADLGEILGEIRVRKGLTCEALDAKAGFADRYTAKCEAAPTAKNKRFGISITPDEVRLSAMAGIWLQALGCTLLVVDSETADELGALPAPVREPGQRRPTVHAPIRKEKIAA